MNIYLNDGTEIPDETCYIIAKDGIYLKKKLDLIESLTKVDKISFLEEIPSFAKLTIPKIPTKVFAKIIGFFKEVYAKYKSEAIVLLYFNKNKKSFKIHVPLQEVGSASLSYKDITTVKNHILIGTIHSHASMSAFHSGTDVDDEEKFDGIHMTVGKINESSFFDLCGSIAVNGTRVPIFPDQYIEGLEEIQYTPYFPQMFLPGFQMINDEKVYNKTVKSSISYCLKVDNKEFKIDPNWLLNVKEIERPIYQFSNYHYKLMEGKLVKVEDKEISKNGCIPPHFVFEDDKESICKHCIHRDEKIDFQKEIDNKDLKERFEEENMLDYLGF